MGPTPSRNSEVISDVKARHPMHSKLVKFLETHKGLAFLVRVARFEFSNTRVKPLAETHCSVKLSFGLVCWIRRWCIRSGQLPRAAVSITPRRVAALDGRTQQDKRFLQHTVRVVRLPQVATYAIDVEAAEKSG